MDENLVGVFEPDNESLVVQYLKDFAYTLGELEVSFRGVEESRELIMGALQAAGHFYEADRVYVLEMDDELQIGINTYEWCSNDAPASIIHSHSIPLEQMPRLGQYLKMNKPLVVQDMEDIQRRYPSEYRWLTQQGIFALIAAPYSKRINTGYIIADNPRKYAHDPSLLLLLQYVIVLELNEIKQQKALNMVSKRVSEQPKMDVHINMFCQLLTGFPHAQELNHTPKLLKQLPSHLPMTLPATRSGTTHRKFLYLKISCRSSLVAWWLGFWTVTDCPGPSSIPGWGMEILQAM